MKMEYKLIENIKKGFIVTREPEQVDDELIITFTGAPSGATAIFENESGNSLYRQLYDATCSIPKEFIKGSVRVTIAALNGQSNAPKYRCETIYSKTVNGVLIVCPNGLDIPQEIISVYACMQDLNNKQTTLTKAIDEVNEKLARLLDGWDIT